MLSQIYSELNFVCEIRGGFFSRGGNDGPIRGWMRSGKHLLTVFHVVKNASSRNFRIRAVFVPVWKYQSRTKRNSFFSRDNF
jgi:hypothetical protein